MSAIVFRLSPGAASRYRRADVAGWPVPGTSIRADDPRRSSMRLFGGDMNLSISKIRQKSTVNSAPKRYAGRQNHHRHAIPLQPPLQGVGRLVVQQSLVPGIR